tara:strand:+ start:1120 stop:1539 length:420 start_codon:yes stop_codon:yes gene_type:complete
MRQTGRVISSDSDHALIQIVRQSACGGNCKSCGGSCSVMGVLISTSNPINAKQGEIVNVDSETNKVLKIAAIFYVVPLIVIVAGIILSKLYFFPDDTSILSDVFALTIGAALYTFSLFLIHLFSRKKTIEYTISKQLRQ